jgi:LysR family hydrogen peroxide-inducible transcriptional activator
MIWRRSNPLARQLMQVAQVVQEAGAALRAASG